MGRIKEIICISCAGSGEVMSLCNPSDPEDGSYHLDGCPHCFGTGMTDQDDFRMVHIPKRGPKKPLFEETPTGKAVMAVFNGQRVAR